MSRCNAVSTFDIDIFLYLSFSGRWRLWLAILIFIIITASARHALLKMFHFQIHYNAPHAARRPPSTVIRPQVLLLDYGRHLRILQGFVGLVGDQLSHLLIFLQKMFFGRQ